MSDCGIPGARLRAATDNDCAALAALASSAHSHPWNERQYRDSIAAGHHCWLLQADTGEAIACCVLSHLFNEAEVLDIAVSPAWRRRGIARALLQQLLGELPDTVDRVLLDVRVSNTPALGLYRSLGFVQDGLRPNYYPAAGGAREDAILMSLAIAAR